MNYGEWRDLEWREQERELQDLTVRIHDEPDHVTAVQMALSCPLINADGRPVFADLMLTRSMLALVNQLQEEMS